MVIEGTIRDVDSVSREVSLFVEMAADWQSAEGIDRRGSIEGDILDLDVPVTCSVYVNGARVKLRLLQPLDHVLVGFKRDGDRAIALFIEVRPQANGASIADKDSVMA